MTTYSHSRLETFENCPYKYKLQYIDRIKRDSKGIEAFVGSCVHDSLEKLYKDLKLCKTYTLPELQAVYEEIWRKEFSESIVITRAGYTFENYFDFGKKCIANYFNRYSPFDQGVTLATELRVNFSLGEDGTYPAMGYIDRLDQRSDGVYEVHDYKTSANPPDEAKLKVSRQLGLYHLAVKEKFSDADNVELVWHYPAIDKEYRVQLEASQIKRLRAETIDLIDEIEAATTFAPSESPLCDWCVYPDLCPSKKHFHKVEQLPVNEYLEEDGVVLVNRLAELKEQETEVKEETAKVKEALVAYAENEKVDVIRGSTKKVRVKIDKVTKYPAAGTIERKELEAILYSAKCMDEVSSLDLRKLSKMVDSGDWPESLIGEIEKFAQQEMSTRINLSKIKDEELMGD